MNTKLIKTIREAIALAGLKDGMTISFHHHLRNGDYVLNLVMDEIAAMGIRDLTVNASALFDTHAPLLDHIKNHVVRKVQTNYISAGIGRQISAGLMDEPVEFRTHGGRRVILRWASPPSMWPLSPRHAPTAWETARESTEDPPAAALDMRSRTRCTQKGSRHHR